MNKSELNTSVLRAMHRPKTLLNSLEIATLRTGDATAPDSAPETPPARVDTPKQAHVSQNAYHDHPDSPLPDTKPQRHQAPALGGADEGKAKGVDRVTVRFVGYRVRPLDPDNFAGSVKDLLDGLRHCGLIQGDEPWRIILETEQVQVKTLKEEKTVIEIH